MSVSRPWESGCRGLNFQRLLRSLAGPIQAFGSAGGFVLSRSAARHTAAHERVRQHYGDVDGRPCPAPALSDGHDSMMEMPAATPAPLSWLGVTSLWSRQRSPLPCSRSRGGTQQQQAALHKRRRPFQGCHTCKILPREFSADSPSCGAAEEPASSRR